MGIIQIDDEFTTKQGYTVRVTDYQDARHVLVIFDDLLQTKLTVESSQLRRGTLKNPNHPVFLGVGYMGQGKFKSKGRDGKFTFEYQHWSNMLTRCYSEKWKEKYPSYLPVSCCSDWHDFQGFAEWCGKQPIQHPGWHLDKDLLLRGNKQYSPSVCVFLPQEVNKFVQKDKFNTKRDLPTGVFESPDPKYKYYSQGSFGHIHKGFIGYYSTVEDAFNAYKKLKEMQAKYLASKYRDILDHRVIDALFRYEVYMDE